MSQTEDRRYESWPPLYEELSAEQINASLLAELGSMVEGGYTHIQLTDTERFRPCYEDSLMGRWAIERYSGSTAIASRAKNCVTYELRNTGYIEGLTPLVITVTNYGGGRLKYTHGENQANHTETRDIEVFKNLLEAVVLGVREREAATTSPASALFALPLRLVGMGKHMLGRE